jgi:hypothetical protein
MKIGDVEIEKIPRGQRVDCQNGCPDAIGYRNGIPYCADCLLTEQQMKWDKDGLSK